MLIEYAKNNRDIVLLETVAKLSKNTILNVWKIDDGPVMNGIANFQGLDVNHFQQSSEKRKKKVQNQNQFERLVDEIAVSSRLKSVDALRNSFKRLYFLQEFLSVTLFSLIIVKPTPPSKDLPNSTTLCDIYNHLYA